MKLKHKKLTDSTRDHINRVLSIHEDLLKCRKLNPSLRVNALFSDLVDIVLLHRANGVAILSDKRIKKIRSELAVICARGEYLLEKHWSKKIAESKSPASMLKEFPYYKNYKKLVKTEVSVIISAGITTASKILFVGSGPLPLTAILLAQEYGLSLSLVDNEQESVCLAKELIEDLSLSNQIEVIRGDIREYADIKKFDVVMISAFAGSTDKDKESIIRYVVGGLKDGALFIARSVDGLPALLYRPIDLAWLGGLIISEVVHPTNDVINSVIIAKKIYE
jgi:nicotianamine synthase